MSHHVVPLIGDLTDSTVLRNLGMGLGHSLLAYKATMRGISKVQVGGPEIVLCLITDDIVVLQYS